MIGRIRSVVRQLRGRTAHELYSRATQRAWALSERALLQLTSARHPGHSAAERTFPRAFFPAFELMQQPMLARTIACLRARVPADESEVLARASLAERGDIQMFGHGVISLGDTPDWQRDPISGLRAPQRHWSTIPYLDRDVVGDHKVVWEINRHQYFVTFGQAYAYTQDERWPRAFMRMLDSWLIENPPTIGMNWCSSLEVSYRAISWIWALQLMGESPTLDAEFRGRVMTGLKAHGRHLERYLSTYFSPNTHLTGEALGLYYIGKMCPELPRSKQWANLGASILNEEINRQVLSDGVYFEQATQYHRYTIEIFLHFMLLGGSDSRRIVDSLNRMFDVLLHITRPDGTIPLIGDDDGGRLVQLDGRPPHDVRALLATGAAWLERNDLAWVGRGDDAAMIWLGGATAAARRDQLATEHRPTALDKSFPAGGLYTMRDGWGSSASVAVIDAGPHGALSFGHSHADPLAIDLTLRGRPLFVDAGTYTYIGDERNAFRSTAAHNTVEIDGIGSSIPDTAFRWKTVSNARSTAWMTTPEFAYFKGTHDGYRTLADPVSHERSVLHNRAGVWVVRDSLLAAGSHDAVVRWHCAPGLAPQVVQDMAGGEQIQVDDGASSRALLLLAGTPSGQLQIDDGWISAQFGQKSPARVCSWRGRTSGNAVLASIVIDTARYSLAPSSAHAANAVGAVVVVTLDVIERKSPESAAEQLVVIVGNGQKITFNARQFEADIVLLRLEKQTGQQLGVITVPPPLPA